MPLKGGECMTAKLFFSAILKFFLGVFLVGLLIFLPAGTLDFFGGRLLLFILFVPMFVAGLVMMVKNPALLKSRLSAKEKQKDQDFVVKLSAVMFLFAFVLAGLGVRFGWYQLPVWVSILGAALFLLAYALYAEVLRENTYLSRTIEVKEEQTVVDTGLYALVRHPMYLATLVLFCSMGLVLGSLYSFLVFFAYPFLIVRRIRGEEAFLRENLAGYDAYCEKVPYRLIPFVW